MLFSRSSSQSSDETRSSSGTPTSSSASTSSSSSASTSSSSSASTSTTASRPQVNSAQHLADWQRKGAAGLGVISSLASECTPLKHRYDACFDLWFRDYLAIGDDQIVQQERGQLPASSGKSRASDSDVEARKKSIMERYDRDCGALFKDYQSCVKKAITGKDLDGLIKQARKENPFPFDHERRSDPRENNPPFPFPAARD